MPKAFGSATLRVQPENYAGELIFKGTAKRVSLEWLELALKWGFINKRNVKRVLDRVNGGDK